MNLNECSWFRSVDLGPWKLTTVDMLSEGNISTTNLYSAHFTLFTHASNLYSFTYISLLDSKLGSVAGPVIQANGRLSFEDDLRSGGLPYCVSQ